MEIAPQSVRNAVVDEDDFAHEMKVASLLNSMPAYVTSHGGTYTDPITRKPRQYDFRASLTKDDARVNLTIECKNLNQQAPLVICGRPRLADEAFHDMILSRQGRVQERSRTIVGLSSITMKAKGSDSIYPKNEFTGKSLLRLKNTNGSLSRTTESDVYDKWSQALSSADEIITAACEIARQVHKNEFYSAFLPIVVVPNLALWKCEYNLEGEIISDPTQTDYCPFFVGRSYRVGLPKIQHSFIISHIHFYTLRGLEELLSELETSNDAWADLMTIRAIEKQEAEQRFQPIGDPGSPQTEACP